MIQAFFNTDLSSGEIFETSDGERKSWVFLIDNREESSCTLTLQIILHVHFSFIHSSSNICFFTHCFTSGCINIKGNNISWGEFPIVNSLFWSLGIDNAFISIDQMFFNFVGKNTLKWRDIIICHDLSNISSHILIGSSCFDGSSGSHKCVVCCENNICLLSLCFSTDNDCVTSVGSISINMGT